ncbi:hypothetical protein ANO14919_070500 [Xylariales sp. No.14919]|nr:hypothetical protein ANO14919_070500 [Xylariales sp. No.14919]
MWTPFISCTTALLDPDTSFMLLVAADGALAAGPAPRGSGYAD